MIIVQRVTRNQNRATLDQIAIVPERVAAVVPCSSVMSPDDSGERMSTSKIWYDLGGSIGIEQIEIVGSVSKLNDQFSGISFLSPSERRRLVESSPEKPGFKFTVSGPDNVVPI
jgi:hypothetical protein